MNTPNPPLRGAEPDPTPLRGAELEPMSLRGAQRRGNLRQVVWAFILKKPRQRREIAALRS